MDLAHVSKLKSLLTKMRILNKGHVQEIYDCLLKKISVSTLTLQPMSYYDAES